MRFHIFFLILSIVFSLQIQSQNELNFSETTQLIKEFENPIVLKRGESRVLVSSILRRRGSVLVESIGKQIHIILWTK